MNIIKTDIEGVIIIEPKIFSDDRGYFFESFSQQRFIENVCETTFVQENESKSTYGVLRGLHYQKPPFAQSKLVRVVSGRVLDVAVDIRKGSHTFGKYVSVELSEDDKTINIDWQIPQTDIILSEKDKISPVFSEAWFFDYNLKLY